MGCFSSKEREASRLKITRGTNPVPSSLAGAFRYEQQVTGPRPTYWNPMTGSTHGSLASATFESYTGKVAGLPRPSSSSGEPRAPRPVRAKPVPKRSSLANVRWSESKNSARRQTWPAVASSSGAPVAKQSGHRRAPVPGRVHWHSTVRLEKKAPADSIYTLSR